MTRFQFRDRIPIDVPHTLQQLLAKFQTVKDGLPELIKNAKDQYSRLGITEAHQRTIVVAVNVSKRVIGVIDFAGAEASQFKRWETWSDPNANARERASDIEGGHGNGGKAFMVLGSTSDSSFESCFQGRRTRMGYDNSNDDKRFKPGIALEDGAPIEDQSVGAVRGQFDRALRELGIKFEQLPVQAQEVFGSRQAFTIARVGGIKEWSRAREETIRRLVSELPRDVETHPQASLSLESCPVWFVVDGQIVGDKPAQVRYPEPLPAFPDALQIPIPDELIDPQTDEPVKTGQGALTLRTSAKSLRMGDLRPLHLIRIRNSRNVVGLWSVADLCPGASSGFVFGELHAPALGEEHLAGADRKSLNDTPLVRALQAWTADQIKMLAERIQQATAKEHRTEDRDKLNHSLKKLRDMMRKFLGDRDRGRGQRGAGAKGNVSQSSPSSKGDSIHEIEVEGGAASVAVAVGASVPLRVKAFERSESGELMSVPSPDLVAMTIPPEMINVDDDFEVKITTAGSGTIWFESRTGGVISNTVRIEGIACTGAIISGIPNRLLLQGETLPIKVSYETAIGVREDLLHDISVDELGMGRVARNGLFVAGAKEGKITLRIRWGPHSLDTSTVGLLIGADRASRKASGGDRGGEIPLILLCGTPIPGMEHYPAEQRTIMPSEHYPTIIDFDPAFENVIFINPDSKESIQARKGRGGRKGMAGIATDTYYQFIALKCFEILKRLWVFEQARETPLTEVQFRERFATAETECAPFIEAAYKVAEAITEAGGAEAS